MRRFVLPGVLGVAAVFALFACGAASNQNLGLGAQGGDDSSGDGSGDTGTGSGSSAHTGSGGASTGTNTTSSAHTGSGGASTGTNSGGASTGTNSGGASTGTNSGGASGTSTTSTAANTSATSSTGAGGAGPACPPEGSLVYVLDSASNLYSFDPPGLTFTKIGLLNCPSNGQLPYSMAVSRDGTAYSVFEDGHLFQIDTKTAKCTATSFVPSQHGFTTFGMGFSANSPGSVDETLYVSQAADDGTTTGLGKIDIQSFVLTPIGMYNDAVNARAELTGTGNAELFGAFEGMPYFVDQVDKTNANILSQASQGPGVSAAPGGSNFAFAYWGGDFWLFVGTGIPTGVFHYQPALKTTTQVSSADFEIVGAGVSICAPTHM